MNSAQLEPNASQEIEVGIASADSRVFAYLLNCIFQLIALIPLILGIIVVAEQTKGGPKMDKVEFFSLLVQSGWVQTGFVVWLLYVLVQIYFMGRDGQSLGKKVLRIRILKINGSHPGFTGTVFMREVLYNIIVSLVAGGAGKIIQLATGGNGEVFNLINNVVSFSAMITCFVMLFKNKNDRRTLQDYLADTVVVKLPPKKR